MDKIISARTARTAAFNKNADDPGNIIQRYHQAVEPSKLAEYGAAQIPVATHNKNMDRIAAHAIRLLPPALSNMLNAQGHLRASRARRNADEFLDGHRHAYMTRAIDNRPCLPQDIAEKINDHLSKGLIQCRKFECEENADMVIFGQIGQERNIDNLAYILRNYDNYDAIQNNDRGITHKTEGQILGYSDQDIDLFQGQTSFGKMHNFILNHTHEIRRDIRQGLMKEMGPQWNRNP